MRRTHLIGILIVAQVALLGLYVWVQTARQADSSREEVALSAAPGIRVSGQLPQLSLVRSDGSQFELSLQRPTLVHFWASWCPPCRAELPDLLALPDRQSVDVVAVSLDSEWRAIERFPGGSDARVVMGNARQVRRLLDVHTLPVTYLVAPGGGLQLRFDGARSWGDLAWQVSGAMMEGASR